MVVPFCAPISVIPLASAPVDALHDLHAETDDEGGQDTDRPIVRV
jgi:hypothetical protein